MIRILYFARLREALGTMEERLDWPGGSVAELMAQLARRDAAWQREFGPGHNTRAAVNQTLVALDARVRDGDEVAFFPPVTGG